MIDSTRQLKPQIRSCRTGRARTGSALTYCHHIPCTHHNHYCTHPRRYLFVSLLSRDSVYDVLRRVCTHLQVNGKKILSIKQYTEEPSALSLLLPHDEFPTPEEFPPVLKWRRKPSTASIASSLPDILGNSTSSLSAVDASFQSDSTTQERSLETEKVVMVEPVPELGQMEYQLLKFFILLIVLLICSSCYLAFRVSSLEHQLSFLNTNPLLPANER